MSAANVLCGFLLAATLAACGGDSIRQCVPACVSRQCGADGCGGSCGTCPGTASCSDGACVEPARCTASCAGKLCGDDGCGGSCGACPSGVACLQGSCQALPPSGCPQGGVCIFFERTAWSYDCTSADQCQRSSVISRYGSFEACQTWGCMGGNSRCGDQFGNASDAARWSCEQCKASCHDAGEATACSAANETAQGCLLWDSLWGSYLADCICQ